MPKIAGADDKVLFDDVSSESKLKLLFFSFNQPAVTHSSAANPSRMENL